MAETELAIVVRARDQLTATLRQMGTTVEELARKVAADFNQASRATDTLSAGVRKSAADTTNLGREVSAAVEQVRRLGQADTSQLEVSIRSTRAEIERLRAGTAAELIPGGAILAAEHLEQQVRDAEQALASLKKTGSEIDIASRIAQAEQAVISLGQHASLGPLEAEVERAKVELTAMRDQATRAGVALNDLDRARLDRLASDVKEGEAALLRLRGGTDQARDGATLLGRTFVGVGATIKSALLPILPILTLAGGAFAAQRSVSEALALEDALSRINAEANLTAAELDVLRNGAIQTARALGLSESKAAPALLGAVTDGARDAAEGLDRFQAAARLAAARGEDVGKVTDALTSILNAYRGANLEAARASDVLFEIARSGKVEVAELAGSLDAVLPLASSLGVSFEELGAILVTATQKGGSFEQGMQAVRAVLGALTNAGPEARDALEGIDFSASRIRAEGLVPVLREISAQLDGNAEAIRAVFPDGRAFGAVLSLVADEGAGLTQSLDQLVRSSGAVEQALGSRLRDPVFQLGVLFNSMRSSFAGAFGGAFLQGIERAIEQMGGMEAATRAVSDVAGTIGSAFGSAVPGIIAAFADTAKAVSDLIGDFGGAENAMRRFGAAGVGTARAVAASFNQLAETVDLVGGVIRATSGIALFTNIGADDLQDVNDALALTNESLEILAARDAVTVTPELNRQELARIEDALESIADVPVGLTFDEAGLERLRAHLEGQKIEYEAIVRGERGIAELKRRLGEVWAEFDRDSQDSAEQFRKAFAELAGDLDLPEQVAPKPVEVQVRADFDQAQRQIAGLEAQLGELQRAARFALALPDSQLEPVLALLGARADALRDGLDAARESAQGFRDALAKSIEADIAGKEGEIRKVEQGLSDARSQAQLLGVEGARTARLLGGSFTTERVVALREEIEQLKGELRILRGETVVVDVQIGSGAGISDLLAGFKNLGAHIASRFDPGALARIGRLAGIELRDSILAGVGVVDPFEETLRLFRGGIEPSLGRQVELIEEQVGRQRNATAELRQALPLLRAMGLLSEDRIHLLDQETDKLERSAGLLQPRAAVEATGLRRQAIELGIDPNLDQDELRLQIDEAQDFLDRETLAIRLGVALDDQSIADAQRELQQRADSLELRQVRRDAAYFGLAIDERAVEQLKADIADAQEEAQAFADSLQGRGVRSEALALGISIAGKSTQQIEQDIAELQVHAQEFANANPIEADLLVSAIQGGSNAIAQFITGAKSGKEALRDFFSSMAAQAAQAAAQLLIVRSLIGAFGASSGIGAFLSTTFPGAAASAHGNAFAPSGATVAFARGGMIEAGFAGTSPAGAGGPGLLPRPSGALSEAMAYANGGTTSAPLWIAPTAVERFAMGGSPYLERIVDRPTLERSERLAGSAIVPLSGGGVATTGGERLPVERRGSELVVMRKAVAHALGGAPEVWARAYASGGAPWALFGEAGRESVMRMHRAPDGRPGLRASDGAVLPLTRVEGGRLGVEAHAAGQLFGMAERFALGGLLTSALGAVGLPPLRGVSEAGRRGELGATGRPNILSLALGGHFTAGALGAHPAPGPGSEARALAEFALGGLPEHEASTLRAHRGHVAATVAAFALGGLPDLHRSLWTAPQAFELGGVPDVRRTLKTLGVPFADGGIPDATRTLRTIVAPYAAGGTPGDLSRALNTWVQAYGLGGAPDLTRSLRTSVEAFSAGGLPDARAYQPLPVQAFAFGGSPSVSAQPRPAGSPISVSVPVTVNVATQSAPASSGAREERPDEFGARLQVAISSSRAVQEVIASVVIQEMERRPGSYGSAVRGDRA